jgi:replicative DNA helicase
LTDRDLPGVSLETDAELEAEILGAMMRDRSTIPLVRGILEASHFPTDLGQRVAGAIFALDADRAAITLAAICDRMRSSDRFDVSEAASIQEMHDAGAISGVEYLAGRLRESWLLRQLDYTVAEIRRDVRGRSGPAEQMIADAVQKITALLSQGGGSDDFFTLPEIIDAAASAIDARSLGEQRGHTPTKLLALDEQLSGGLTRGELITIAARTSVGKTALALAIARRVLADGGVVFFASLEQACIELAYRMLASHSGISLNCVAKECLKRDEVARVVESMHYFRGQRMFSAQRRDQTVSQIAIKAAKAKHQAGALDLIVVDYTQLVKAEDRRPHRAEQIGVITGRLRQLAGDLDVPVIALAQLNRETENHELPKLSDLKDSGNIEQDSDTVILLSRTGTSPAPGVEIIRADVAKSRNGQRGEVCLRFTGKLVEFDDLQFSDGGP